MKILITGATGFAGGHILRYFSKIYGIENVHGTGRNKSITKELSSEGFTIKQGDLLDESFVEAQLSTYDIYIHCAAKSSIWGSYDTFFQANVMATKTLLKFIGLTKQIIYISSANMYFNYTDRLDIKETDPLSLNNHYSTTKHEAEQLILESTESVKATVLRTRAIIGVGDTVIFPRLVRAHNEGRLRVVGSGENVIDFTSINNLCSAIQLCVEKRQEANRQVYNISNGDTIVLWNEIRTVLTGLGFDLSLKSIPYNLAYMFARYQELTTGENDEEPAMTCYGVGVLNYSIHLNIDKAKKELAYEPVESSKQTLKDFVDWYKVYSMKA